MEITPNLVEHIARLARLDLSAEEVKEFTPQLKEVLESFSKLDELDTNKVLPSFHPLPVRDSLRDDLVTECLSVDDALLNADHKKDAYFKGPRAV